MERGREDGGRDKEREQRGVEKVLGCVEYMYQLATRNTDILYWAYVLVKMKTEKV